MGRRLAGSSARFDPDLGALNVFMRGFVMAALIFDGVISAILGAALLNTRFGGVLVPLGLIIAAVLNVLLVWSALQWAPTPRWVGAPCGRSWQQRWCSYSVAPAAMLSSPGFGPSC